MRLKCLYCSAIACVVWLASCATALLAQGTSEAQSTASRAAGDEWHFQFDLFQLLLERQGLAPVATAEQIFAKPADSVIVVVGDPLRLPKGALGRLSQFAQSGGSLLLATDNPATVPGVARFQGRVTAGNARNAYQGYADCVKVTAVAQDSPLSGVSTIVTNRSGWLEPETFSPFSWNAVASFPEDCSPPDSRGKPLLAIGRPDNGGAGRIVLSADASLFTNGMLWHGDNAILAIRITSLVAGAGRTRLMFWVDGQALPTAHKRIDEEAAKTQPKVQTEQPLPEPRLDKALKLANALAREVARSNVLNETLMRRPRDVSASHYFRILLILATIALLLAAAWFIVNSGALRPFSATGRKAHRPTARRQRMLQSNASRDYRAPAGYLAREFCWELTGSRQSTEWQKYLAQQLVFEPALNPSDQQELAKIIDIASRGCRERMTAADFQQLGKTIAALRTNNARPAALA